MAQAVSIGDVSRIRPEIPGVAEPNWRIYYFGRQIEGAPRRGPQAYRVEMPADRVLKAHFHAVNQYQIFFAGEGRLGREAISGLTVHYTDHHTGYGPIVANWQGFSYLTLRPRMDEGIVYLDDPGFRARLRPSRKRHRTVTGIGLCIEPVMASRAEPVLQPLFDATDDGAVAFMLRAGARGMAPCPDPRGSGGQYVLVVNGTLVHEGRELREHSLVWLEPQDAAYTVHAGPAGVEVLVLQFPFEGADE